MKKTIFTIILATAVLIISAAFSTAAVAKPERKAKNFSLTANAQKISHGVYYLGKSKDVNGLEVEGYAYVHYKENKTAKAGKTVKVPACYAYLASGAKWRTAEDYLVDPENSRGLTAGFISANLAYDINKWEDAADGFLDGQINKQIIGNEIATSTSGMIVDGADTVAPDNKNEVYLADIADPDAIAVTIVWGYFGGLPKNRAIIEWDQVYDDIDYDWSADGEAGKMDFENIATHELGHTVGMDDIYNTACAEVTMYGYAGYGETNKRTLEQPDINGIKNLYR